MRDDLLLFGIQGSGKGTQAQALVQKYGFSLFETGAELRKIREQDSPLGQEVRDLIDRGELVPNSIVMTLVEQFLENVPEKTPILFDGVPRSLPQKKSFDALLQQKGRKIQAFVFLVPKEEAIARMLARGRTDDTPEAILRRIDLYTSETLPVLSAYRDEGVLTSVDALLPPGKVTEECLRLLEKNSFSPR